MSDKKIFGVSRLAWEFLQRFLTRKGFPTGPSRCELMLALVNKKKRIVMDLASIITEWYTFADEKKLTSFETYYLLDEFCGAFYDVSH